MLRAYRKASGAIPESSAPAPWGTRAGAGVGGCWREGGVAPPGSHTLPGAGALAAPLGSREAMRHEERGRGTLPRGADTAAAASSPRTEPLCNLCSRKEALEFPPTTRLGAK